MAVMPSFLAQAKRIIAVGMPIVGRKQVFSFMVQLKQLIL